MVAAGGGVGGGHNRGRCDRSGGESCFLSVCNTHQQVLPSINNEIAGKKLGQNVFFIGSFGNNFMTHIIILLNKMKNLECQF